MRYGSITHNTHAEVNNVKTKENYYGRCLRN